MRHWDRGAWGLVLWITFVIALAGFVGGHLGVFVLWQFIKHGTAMVGVVT